MEKEKNEFYSYNEKDYSYGATDTNGQMDVWKFTPVSYRTSALWGCCPKWRFRRKEMDNCVSINNEGEKKTNGNSYLKKLNNDLCNPEPVES